MLSAGAAGKTVKPFVVSDLKLAAKRDRIRKGVV
jgi:hypothetical protein